MDGRVFFDLPVRCAFFDSYAYIFEVIETDLVPVLAEKVKEEFRWLWDQLENNSTRVELFFKHSGGDYFSQNSTMGELKSNNPVEAVVEIYMEQEQGAHLDDVYVDNFEFSLFNNLVKIFVQGNNTMVVRDLIEVMKPVLVATGHKSYDRIEVTQGDSKLDLKMPLNMVSDEVIYLTHVIYASKVIYQD